MAVGKIGKTSVDALATGQTLFDDELKGFMVRARAGAKVYALKYVAAGRQRIMTLGEHGVLTPDQARKLALQAKAQAARGEDPQQRRDDDKARSEAATFAAFCDLYDRRHIANKKARSVGEDRRQIERTLKPLFGPRPLAAITKADVLRLKDRFTDRPVAFNRLRALLHHMYEMARRWDLHAGPNPATDVPKNKEKARVTTLSAADYKALFTALKDAEAKEHPSVILAIRLLALTGARLSEILTLEWRHVDIENAALRLPDSKTGAKVIALGAPALALLAGQKRVSEFVCYGRDMESPLAPPQRQWRRIRTAAGLSGLHIHDLRHGFASTAAMGGEAMKLIGAALGHSSTQMTDRYIMNELDPVRAAADRVSRRIEAFTGASITGDKSDGGASAENVVSMKQRRARKVEGEG